MIPQRDHKKVTTIKQVFFFFPRQGQQFSVELERLHSLH